MGKLEEKKPLGKVDVYGRIILKCTSKKQGGKAQTALIGLRIGMR